MFCIMEEFDQFAILVRCGGGSSGGGGSSRSSGGNPRRIARTGRDYQAGIRGPAPRSPSIDFNRNGRITDELAAGATIGAGAVTMATPAPGGRLVGGLTIGAGLAGYADASR